MLQHTRLGSSGRDERGAAAMFAIFMLGTVFALMFTALTLLQTSKQLIGRQLTYEGQALNAAHAGLIDGLAWFRRQTTQPVTSFAPARNLSATPPINETDDATVGLARDFEISALGSVWGRYEVRHASIQDVSIRRGKDAAGTIWLLESEGIVYFRKDLTKAYDEAPNVVIGRQRMRTEVQRLTLVLPANAAISALRGDGITTATRSRVLGGSNIGLAYSASTGNPSTSGPVSGSPARSSISPWTGSIQGVFGVTQQELINMADLVVSSAAELPAEIPDMYLICIRGNATFTPARPLTGTGILVVFGNLTINANSYSNYNGLIYTTGNYTMNAPAQVSGAIVAGGTVALNGSGDFSEVSFDNAILTEIQRQVGQYRFNRNPNQLSARN